MPVAMCVLNLEVWLSHWYGGTPCMAAVQIAGTEAWLWVWHVPKRATK